MKIPKYMKLLLIEWGVEIGVSFGLTAVGLLLALLWKGSNRVKTMGETSKTIVENSLTIGETLSAIGQLLFFGGLTVAALTGAVICARLLFLQIPISIYCRRKMTMNRGFSLKQTLAVILLVYIPPFSIFMGYMHHIGALEDFNTGLVLSVIIPPCIAALAAPIITYYWKGQLFESHFDKKQMPTE